MKVLATAMVLLLGGGTAIAQASGGTWLTFTIQRPGATPPGYQIRLDEETGRGFFRSAPLAGEAASATAGGETPISVQPATMKKLFAAVPLVKSDRCESHNKNIAQTGIKTLRYTAGGSSFECTYNYSLDDRVNVATAYFEAIGETMRFGERLTAKLRFDRLGLDADMDGLQSAATEGRAIELGNIIPVLQKLENDDRVMDRVRRKAEVLLQMASTGAQPARDKDTNDR